MTQKHTQGPWRFGNDKGYCVKDAHGRMVANCHTFDQIDRERYANAHLIAAAPDLLEALIEVEQMIHAGELNQGTMDIVATAIAKARGQS